MAEEKQDTDEYKLYIDDMDTYAVEAKKVGVSVKDFLLERVGIEEDIVKELLKNWVPTLKIDSRKKAEVKPEEAINGLSENTPKENIPIEIVISKYFYLLITFLSFMPLLSFLVGGNATKEHLFDATFSLFVCGIIYYGLLNIKSWVRFLILFYAYWCLIFSFITFMSPAESANEALSKMSELLWFAFFAYQIIIFSRPKIKTYFRDKGITLVS